MRRVQRAITQLEAHARETQQDQQQHGTDIEQNTRIAHGNGGKGVIVGELCVQHRGLRGEIGQIHLRDYGTRLPLDTGQ